MERLKRYEKQIVAVMSALVILVGGIFSTSFQADASATGVNNGIEYFVNYAEPATSDYEGYLNVLMRNTVSQELCVQTFFWYTCATKDSLESPAYLYLTIDSDMVAFVPAGSLSASGGFIAVSYFDQTGQLQYLGSSSSNTITWNSAFWGWEIVGYKYAGNVGTVNACIVNNQYNYTVYFSEDGTAVLLMDVISLLQQSNKTNSDIYNMVVQILYSSDEINVRLSDLQQYIKYTYYEVYDLRQKVIDLLNAQMQTNNWLQDIWISIQKFFNPSVDEQEENEKFESETSESSGTINELNQQNKTEKVDINSASSSVDKNIDVDSIGSYGLVLANITENEYILQMLLMVFAIGLVAYVLFGKK